MKEKIILRFKLPMIESLSFINALVSIGYRDTGNKFSVSFNGSKGYLDNIEISCEGYQKEENRIFLYELTNKNGRLKSVMVNVFYSDAHGIRVSIGKDEPKIIRIIKKDIVDNDLPF